MENIAADFMLGQILNDRYRIAEVVHKGGTSIIYKAEHELMKRTVAVKLLSPSKSGDTLSIKRFQQEAQAASHLRHPGLITVYDYGFRRRKKLWPF